ncbi:ECF transporter S component [Enterococcus olivae]
MKPRFFEKKSMFSTYETAYLAMMVAACVVGRLMFQFIPNVQPMTAIFLILTCQLGISRGLIVNVLSLLITNMYLGMGVWTISQILSFSAVILLMGLLCKWQSFREKRSWQVLFSIAAGFIYGFIIACIDVQLYGIPYFLPYYFAGLSFDFLHGLGNGGFYFLLAPVFNQLIKLARARH